MAMQFADNTSGVARESERMQGILNGCRKTAFESHAKARHL
ncbi:MAG TPA: hypothetical protein VN715_01770 [Roseiarcus sp.]|nr:hypothetical protein [Roseiarcus sp.]